MNVQSDVKMALLCREWQARIVMVDLWLRSRGGFRFLNETGRGKVEIPADYIGWILRRKSVKLTKDFLSIDI